MRLKNTFSNNLDDTYTEVVDAIKALLRSELGEKVSKVMKLLGGINSEAFRVLTDRNNEYFVKKYITRKGDNRNRLSTEFSGLSFLWANGIRNIPEPLLASECSNIVIYRFVNGSKIFSGKITLGDIDEAANFAGKLHSLIRSKGAEEQPVASEACFSIQAYIDCVEERFDRLRSVTKKGSVFNSMRECLEDEFLPFFNELKEFTIQKAKKYHIDINKVLHDNERTLSASDFGFHNAIRTTDKHIYFIDFEYYGWDDPAKMIADFYLQPAVHVPIEYRKHFFKKVRGKYCDGLGLEKRLSIIYPILGLKWCLIMLNTFLHVDDGENYEANCLEYLDKSMRKFKEIKDEIACNVFPIALA